MRYLPQTQDEIRRMCEAIGVTSPGALFEVIPESLRLKQNLDLAKPLGEADLIRQLKGMARSNETVDSLSSFLGGGAYHHYIPVAVSSLTGRGEFQTAYTPYQPEISQGTLQAIFEFQTMIASLTGMDLANAGNYDGASALAEAVLMALRITKRSKVLLTSSIHPDYRQVVKTYLTNLDCEIIEIPFNEEGRIEQALLREHLDDKLAVLCVQSPNALGIVEKIPALSDAVHACGGLLVGCFSEALSMGLLQPLGKQGADMVVGEGASFGNFLNLGGPYLGLFACKQEFVRQMPGRLVGETLDADGKRGFVLVLSTREQHIRREKATSNICTNQALCALGSAIYLSLVGPQGLRQLAETNYSHAQYLKNGLLKIPGVEIRFSGPHFNEFVLKLARPVPDLLNQLRSQNILGGIAIESWAKGLENCLLICATEMNTKAQMDEYIDAMHNLI